MVATILGLLMHLAQTIGLFWYSTNASPAMVVRKRSDLVIVLVLDLVGFILPSYLLLIVHSFRFTLLNLNNS